MASPAVAADKHADAHGGQIFHAFSLETDYGAGQDDAIGSWDFDGWVGGDVHKLHLKSEGEIVDDTTEQAEFWAMYGHNFTSFWDAQVGVRHDTQPAPTTYLVVGVEGLAPHFFETETHLFVSDEGDVSVRLRQEIDFLVSQRFILQPYLEANLYAQDVTSQEVGAGLADVEIGVQARYEITRKFAPFVDVRYERKFGKTASIAKRHGNDNDDFIVSAGFRFMF